jgi:hypothetical protein
LPRQAIAFNTLRLMSRTEDVLIRRTRWVVIATVALLACALVGSVVWWRLHLSYEVDGRLRALQRAGLPTSGAELNQWYAAVPDRENAALVMTQAFALMRTFPDQRSNEISRFKPPPRGQPLSREQVQLLSDYVNLNSAALERATEALMLPQARFPIDLSPGADALLPHLSRLKTLAQTVSYQTMLAIEAHHGADAARLLKTTLGLARTLDSEPLLISQLVRIAVLRIARQMLELKLNAGNTSESELTDLASAFAGLQVTNLMVRALVGEQAMAIPHFHMSWAQMSQLAKDGEDGSEGPEKAPLPGGQPLLFRVTGLFERDLRFYLAVMRTNIELAALGPPGSLVAINRDKPVEARIRSRHYILSGLFLTALSRALVKEAECVASARICAAALSLQRFRLVHDRLPKDLNELVPRFLTAIPLDPFDGAPLRYKPLVNGYVVYSIGPDGRDDGGKEPPIGRRGTERSPEDITITVER